MKVTLDVPDELLQSVKAVAAERKTTLQSLILKAIEQLVRRDSEEISMRKKLRLKQLLSAMKASNEEPMQPLKRSEIYKF